MPIKILSGDVFGSSADTLALTLAPDTQSQQTESLDLDRFFGNVGRAYPKTSAKLEGVLRQSLEQENEFLGQAGTALLLEIAEGVFPQLLLLNTLSHHSRADSLALATRAAAEGLKQAFSAGYNHLAMTPLTGGWRLGLDQGFHALVAAFLKAITLVPKDERMEIVVEVWSHREEEFQRLKELFSRL